MQVLGEYGCRAKNKFTTCFKLNDEIVIDAGNLMELGEEAKKIKYIFLTHSHLDHICDIPFLIDNFFEEQKESLTIFGLAETIEALQKFIFNWKIWPDFQEIDLLNGNSKGISFKTIEIGEEISIGNYSIKALSANHTVPTVGYLINDEIYLSGDTYLNENLIEEINSNKNIKKLIIETSFPSRLENLAKTSKHLTPTLLQRIIDKIKRDDLEIFIYHIKPSFEEEILSELSDKNLSILKNGDIL